MTVLHVPYSLDSGHAPIKRIQQRGLAASEHVLSRAGEAEDMLKKCKP